MRAYNDWLSEYVEHAPERFGGLAVIPNRGVDGALAEIDRVVDRPGIRGFVMGCYPNGTLAPAPDDDKVFGAHRGARRAAEHPRVAHRHDARARTASRCPGWGRIFDIPNRMLELIFAGVFDRFPGLQMVAAEVDCGWLPYVKEQIDNNFQRLAPGSTFPIKRRPSEYIEQPLPLRVHDRPDGHPPPRLDRRRAHAVVVGLPARVVGLAALVAHHPGDVLRRARPPSAS